ncbi:MAG: beta-N-acetylhexosaminidase [Acidobacteriota bacterium]|nr:beta-N-acetylhexosaminidase [Acidobacteriota bacterium]
MKLFNWFFLATLLTASLNAGSPLLSRGYTAIPEPRQVRLGDSDFSFGPRWRLSVGTGVRDGDIAVAALREGLAERFHTALRAKTMQATGAGPVLRLSIAPNSVAIGAAVDGDKDALAAQAYRLQLSQARISIAANAPAGLFYGVETLIQLLAPRDGELWLPEGEIVDWPDLRLRQIYWDDAHHLESMAELKRAVRQAAFYKINGFAIKLEGHFQFRSAPALVEPQALSPAQYQELTDYGLRYHIQVIPYLDGPGHIAFILKHPEYAKLREYPESNYELCLVNPDSYKLLFGMFDDLIAANRGVKYFYLSTDEAYYVGLANNPQCREQAAAEKLGSVGKLLAEFVTKAAGHLRDRGREVIFWGEYPLKAEDLPSLPTYVINGEVDRAFDRRYRELGIRQMIYTSTEGEEKLFPQYFALPASKLLHVQRAGPGRVVEAFEKIANDTSRKDSDLIGALVAGWADMGLHPETFWLGYATATSASWNPSADPRELMSSFYPLFFGPSTIRIDRVYQLLSEQAQFWSDSWETVPSTARKPIFGNSYAVFNPPHPAKDQTLPLPPLPSVADLRLPSDWERGNARRMELAAEFRSANDELGGLVLENLRRATRNRYTLDVFNAITALCRQNLDLLGALSQINADLVAASTSKEPKAAVAHLDRALDSAAQIRLERNRVLREATAAWYKSWLPRVSEANGRRFLHEVDDVKDHLPDRTVDMSYLVYRELQLPMQAWADELAGIRNRYAESHGLPRREFRFSWADLS